MGRGATACGIPWTDSSFTCSTGTGGVSVALKTNIFHSEAGRTGVGVGGGAAVLDAAAQFAAGAQAEGIAVGAAPLGLDGGDNGREYGVRVAAAAAGEGASGGRSPRSEGLRPGRRRQIPEGLMFLDPEAVGNRPLPVSLTG
jgi:hypothetical protein